MAKQAHEACFAISPISTMMIITQLVFLVSELHSAFGWTFWKSAMHLFPL